MHKVILILCLCSLGINSLAQEIKSDSSKIFLIVEQSAEFPGGYKEFYKYCSAHMKYPKDARKQGISGKAFVEFIVTEDGSIEKSSVRVIPAEEANRTVPPSPDGTKQFFHDLPESCNMEAIKVVKNSPDWKPGMRRGKPVRQMMVVPIQFKL